MKFVFLSFFLICANVFAYTMDDVNLSNLAFTRYVRPQLINISTDYGSLMAAMNPELKEFKPIHKSISKLQRNEARLTKLNVLDNPRTSITITENLLQTLRKSILILDQYAELNMKPSFGPDQMIGSFHHFYQFYNSYLNLYQAYSDLHFFIQTGVYPGKDLLQLKQKTNEVYNLFNLYLIESSDPHFKNEFINFWNNFIKPVNTLILPRNDKVLFISKINDLNLTINILNALLTKGNKSISKQPKTLLKIMHHRWVSVLKVTLKR
ncbi:MAG: hypothetical protein OEW87_12215 [Flavobacteriaceae bacterium]|nr:hypothetical protein [Flavobacteriaceae bacterium]